MDKTLPPHTRERRYNLMEKKTSDNAMVIEIGPIKYRKKEESTVITSFVLGIASGMPLGASLSYFAGYSKSADEQYPI